MKFYLIIMWLVALGLSGCTSIRVAPQPGSMTSDEATTAVTGLGAVDKLIAKGDQQRRNGRFAQAAATLERALRLAPGSGAAYLALARVRLDQKRFKAAQQLAEKSLSLTSHSRQAQREAWLIVAETRRQLGDVRGAKRATANASGY